MVDAAVSETIVELLGENVSKPFFEYLADKMCIPRGNVPQQLKMVFSTLEGQFGIAGRTIGRAIIRNLYRNLGMRYAENPNYQLFDYVEDALFDYIKQIILLSDGQRKIPTDALAPSRRLIDAKP